MFTEAIAIDILQKTHNCLWIGNKPIFKYKNRITFNDNNIMILQPYEAVVLFERPIDLYENSVIYIHNILSLLQKDGYVLFRVINLQFLKAFNIKIIYQTFDKYNATYIVFGQNLQITYTFPVTYQTKDFKNFKYQLLRFLARII